MNVPICGVDGSACKEFGVNCLGCNAIEGKVFWSAYMGLNKCPMYHCCVDYKKLSHCGNCDDLPCNIYFETRDPETTEDEHQKAILKRVERLKSLS